MSNALNNPILGDYEMLKVGKYNWTIVIQEHMREFIVVIKNTYMISREIETILVKKFRGNFWEKPQNGTPTC